jgi:hypothetical protein
MKKISRTFLFCSLFVSLGLQAKNSANDTVRIAAEPDYEVKFEPIVEFHGEAFPSIILATLATPVLFDESPRMQENDTYIGDKYGDFGVAVEINGVSTKPVSVRIEIESDRFIKKSTLRTKVPVGKKIEIFPRIAYDVPALERQIIPTTDNVRFRLYIDNSLVEEDMKAVRFHSVNEIPYAERNRRCAADNQEDSCWIDHSWLFAAFVNEDNPLIDKILKEANEIGIVEKLNLRSNFSFAGYQDQNGDGSCVDEVLYQVLSVWSVFQQRHIKYSNITKTSTKNSAIRTQYVRSLEESFSNKQANCVDGTVLFASVLLKIGIEPILVLVPGHMFLGFLTGGEDDEEKVIFLETTLIGNYTNELDNATDNNSWLGRLKNWSGIGETQAKISYDCFFHAIAYV